VDLGGEEGGAPPAKLSNISLLEEAAYVMYALAGDPRANAHYMELHKEDVAWRETSCVSAQEHSCAVRACIVFVKIICAMSCALVTCAPCQAPSSSCSLNRRTYTPKLSSTRLPKAPLYPFHSPLRVAPLARDILDVVSNCWFREFWKWSLDWGQCRNVVYRGHV
jgi:hypothetical protein